jgi:hypothetical protein
MGKNKNIKKKVFSAKIGPKKQKFKIPLPKPHADSANSPMKFHRSNIRTERQFTKI